MTAATTLVGGDGEGAREGLLKLTEWKGPKGSKAWVRRGNGWRGEE